MPEIDSTTTEASDPRPWASSTTLYLIVQAPDATQVIRLDEGREVIAGRGDEAALRIAGSDVSRPHAVFRRAGALVEVEDLGSRNGTWLDGQRIAGRATLMPSATVRIGPAQIGLAVCAEAPGRSTPGRRAPGDELDAPPLDDSVIVADDAMRALYTDALRVARAQCTVLITGETGAGKELVAEYIHQTSPRAGGRFVRLNCAAVPESLLESELFGYERGAFTGAERRREGWFEAASGGTLYLDEIGEMPPAMQAKLLRVFESGRVTRLGGTTEIAVDVRVVCATHRDLEAAVAAGSFRADLFYRVAGVILGVPPLRERPTEITLLAARFAAGFAARMGAMVPSFEPEAIALLLRHRWPGNVRELRNAMERAVALCRRGRITAADLPEAVRTGSPAAPAASAAMRDRLDEAERDAIAAALASEHGNQTRAARRLGISRRNLVYKLTKYGLR